MKVVVSFDFSEADRRAIGHYLGQRDKAPVTPRSSIVNWIEATIDGALSDCRQDLLQFEEEKVDTQ